MTKANARNKAATRAYWNWADTCPIVDLSAGNASLTQDVAWCGFSPLTDTTGSQAIVDQYLRPLRQGFSNLKRDIHIVMGGVSDGRADGGADGRHWVAGTGYLRGIQTGDLWGTPARNRALRLRWGEFLEFDEAGQICRIEYLIDVIDWLEQLGLSPLPAPRGAPFVYPAPTGTCGQLWEDQGDASELLAFARQFIFGGLNAFDESNLKSMGMADYFHPNLKAMPDRGAVRDGLTSHFFADGDYVAVTDWPNMIQTISADGWLGIAPAGKKISMKSLDFWRLENGLIRENWVMVDILDVYRQLGVDVLARMREFNKVRVPGRIPFPVGDV